MAFFSRPPPAPKEGLHQKLLRRGGYVVGAACFAWIYFYLFGIVLASVRIISYKNIAQLHGAVLAAYLLSIAPADMLLRSILASLLFQFTIKFIGEKVGSVFVLRKPLKLNENLALVVLATVSLILVAGDIFYWK